MKLLFSVVLLLPAWIASAQYISQETYCIEFKEEVDETYFDISFPDTVSGATRTMYKDELEMRGRVLSRFDERPLNTSTNDVFRVVHTDAFRNDESVRIIKIEKGKDHVWLTIKYVRKQKRRHLILIHKKKYTLDVWGDFQLMVEKNFIGKPFEVPGRAVHDGGSILFEGLLSRRYQICVAPTSFYDLGLKDILTFLYIKIGMYDEVKCKDAMRDH